MTRYTESGPQTQTVQIDPTHLMARRLFASGGDLDEHLSEPAKGRDGPRVTLRNSAAAIWPGKSVGQRSVAINKVPKILRMSCAAYSTVASETVTADELVSTGLWFHRIELLGLRFFAPQVDCNRQRCGVTRDSHQRRCAGCARVRAGQGTREQTQALVKKVLVRL
jgi:hypothetical protein